jgi:hypothetical protein
VFLDTINYDHDDLLTDLTWPEPEMEGRDLTWWFGQWGYRIRKGLGMVGNQIAFKPAAVEWVIDQWDGSDTIALGNVFKYEITVDGEPLPDSWFTDDSLCVWKRLWHAGNMALDFSRQRLYVGAHNQLPVPVHQHWIVRGGSIYCAEYVMMDQIDSVHTLWPDKVIWHAATTTITREYTDDTYIDPNLANLCKNYGSQEIWKVGATVGGKPVAMSRVWNVASELGAGQVVDTVQYWALINTHTADDSIAAYRALVPWVEGDDDGLLVTDSGAVWAFFDAHMVGRDCVGEEWTDPGAACANDAVGDNDYGFANQDCASDTVADYKETRESIVWVDGGGWWSWTISADLGQGWYDETYDRNGIILRSEHTGENSFDSEEATHTPNAAPTWPYYVFFHHDVVKSQVIIIN